MFELRPFNRRHNALTYNPFREMDEFEKNFFGSPFGFFGERGLSDFRTDVTDNGDSYLLEADLPGFDKKDITMDVSGDVLTIRAERHSDHEDKSKQDKYIRCERSYGCYTREFDVSGIDTDHIKAKYTDGVLRLEMPKKQQALPEAKHLEIE